VPTLVVWGRADRALNPGAAAAYRAARGRVDVVVLDGVGHLPMLEAPDRVAADYLRFREALHGG
jgi:pimeloyl-ACP methyl ester carboxylesterase